MNDDCAPGSARCAYVFSEDILKYDYGPLHPMKIIRLRLTRDLTDRQGLLRGAHVSVLSPPPASREDILTFHDSEYVDALALANEGTHGPELGRYGIGAGDNPSFPGVYDFSRLSAGASLEAARLVADGEADIAFTISGGLHHAHAARASGFCYINDAVLAIQALVERGFRVAYIDIDAHHGDGVQGAFYGTDRVMTVSLHQDGRTLFPGSGSLEEYGSGMGKGYAVNIPLWPGTGDELFIRAFDEVVVPLMHLYKPEVVVTQLGVDALLEDPLAMLNLSQKGYLHIIRAMKSLFPRWVALGGGGYDLKTVALAWTAAWAEMSGHEIGNDSEKLLEKIFVENGIEKEFSKTRLRFPPAAAENAIPRAYLNQVINEINRTIFPVHKG